MTQGMKLTDAPSCTCAPEQRGHLPGCPWGAWVARYEAEDIDGLIERSSLGTPVAVAVRKGADPKVVARTLRRADELAKKGSSDP